MRLRIELILRPWTRSTPGLVVHAAGDDVAVSARHTSGTRCAATRADGQCRGSSSKAPRCKCIRKRFEQSCSHLSSCFSSTTAVTAGASANLQTGHYFRGTEILTTFDETGVLKSCSGAWAVHRRPANIAAMFERTSAAHPMSFSIIFMLEGPKIWFNSSRNAASALHEWLVRRVTCDV